MAETDTKKADAAPPSLSDLTAKLAKVLAAWPGNDAEPDPAKADAAKPDTAAAPKPPDTAIEATDMAARARKKYDALVHWILGIFSAIGLLVFGSVPFTDLKGVNWALAAPGLALAGVGIAVVITATTTGLEPQLASLGEIAAERERIRHFSKSKKWILKRLGPRTKAVVRFHEVLTKSGESEAHLGPGITSVPQLIKRIGELERGLLRGEVGWRGGSLNPPASPPSSSSGVTTWAASSVYRSSAQTAYRALFDAALKDTADAATMFATATKESSGVAIQANLAQIVALHVSRATAAATLVGNNHVAPDALYATHRSVLETYLSHRALVLQESTVAMLRGTFRLVRALLLLGAVLTLAGGITYAEALSNRADASSAAAAASSTSDTPKVEVTLTIKQNTPAWKKLAKCRTGTGDISGLKADLVSSDDADAAQDGPFTADVIDPRCALTITVPEGDGSYAT